jgi:hypothetical protein
VQQAGPALKNPDIAVIEKGNLPEGLARQMVAFPPVERDSPQ